MDIGPKLDCYMIIKADSQAFSHSYRQLFIGYRTKTGLLNDYQSRQSSLLSLFVFQSSLKVRNYMERYE